MSKFKLIKKIYFFLLINVLNSKLVTVKILYYENFTYLR